MDDFLASQDRHLLQTESEIQKKGTNEFCELAELAISVPQLLRRGRRLLSSETGNQLTSSSSIEELSKLSQDAKETDALLLSWPSFSNRPLKAYTPQRLPPETQDIGLWQQSYHPSIHIYDNAPQVAAYNGWRLIRIYVLALISQTAQLLQQYHGLTIYCSGKKNAEIATQALVDDICASVPFYLGYPPDVSSPKTTRCSPQPRHDALPKTTDAELIANWSQLKHCLSVAAFTPGIPENQRLWMQKYMRLFSSDVMNRDNVAV